MNRHNTRNATIRNALLACALAWVAAGCSQDGPGALAATAATAAPAAVSTHAMADGRVPVVRDVEMDFPGAPGHAGAPALARAPQDGKASAPDRGDLAAYPSTPVVRRAGPYTWHRADISEAHALQAIVDGVLTITAPSGARLEFEYDRHLVHDSGDWTWIGQAVAGGAAQDAILTFGRDAVFGRIPQPGDAALDLVMRDGASWLVETDVEARARQAAESGLYDRPDFLVPEEQPIVQDLQVRAAAAAVGRSGAASAATPTVDVLVGYSSGYKTALGGTSAVTTRINHLVTLTNQAYEVSQVNARVRLVHLMEVNYPDATDNSDALTALTGSTGSTPDPELIDAALRPMHTARDQYGADLMTLVRDFQHPEMDSCGVAWLIGGGQNVTHSGYSVFGMSVVADGQDDKYYCADSTFAHELGHNMGLAHDRDTAMGDDGELTSDEFGRFSYSFGYRTDAANGSFTTIMAYGDDQQHEYNVFSNPDIVACGGFPCGIEELADNARTLRDTFPIVGEFRATVVPDVPVPVAYVADDIDGDGRSDLIWRDEAQTRFAYWLMDGATRTNAAVFGMPGQWEVVARGDFNADAVADIVWSDGAALYLWAGDGQGTFSSTRIADVPSGWNVFAAADVNGDLKDDLVWRNAARTRVGYWLMDGANLVATSIFSASSSWVLSGADDFNADGMADLVWTNGSRLVLWTSTGNGFTSAAIRSHPAGWSIVDTGDVDGDGKAELHWRSDANDRYAYWLLNGSNYLGARAWRVGPAWTLATVGDYNGDGFADLTWTSSTRIVQWVGNGQSFVSVNVRSYPTGWKLLR